MIKPTHEISILFLLRVDSAMVPNDEQSLEGSHYVAAWAGPSMVIQSYTTNDISKQRDYVAKMMEECTVGPEGFKRARAIGERIFNSLGLNEFFKQLITFVTSGLVSRDLLIMSNETSFPWEWAFVSHTGVTEADEHFIGELFNCATMLIGEIESTFLVSLARQLSPRRRSDMDPLDSQYVIITNDEDGDLRFVSKEREFLEEHLKSVGISEEKTVVFDGNIVDSDLRLTEFFRREPKVVPQLIHFAGHMRANGFPLGIDFINGTKISQLLDVGQLTGCSLVVLNCCNSGTNETRYRLSDNRRESISLVKQFLYAGASSCLATFAPIEDEKGLEFIRGFYRKVLSRDESGLFRSVSLAAAMREARMAWREEHPGDFTACSYVLFGTPSVRLISEEERRMPIGRAIGDEVARNREAFKAMKDKARRQGISE